MSRKFHKPHRGVGWKRDVLLMTCILRLRVSPPLPFPLIADIALEHYRRFIVQHYKNLTYKYLVVSSPPALSSGTSSRQCQQPIDGLQSPEEQGQVDENNTGLRKWLTAWLEEKYNFNETCLGDCYVKAIAKDVSVVQEILAACQLYEMGYQAKRERECRRQVNWQKKEAEWRFRTSPQHSGERGTWGYIGEPVAAKRGEWGAIGERPDARKRGMDCEEEKVLKSARVCDGPDSQQRMARVNEELLARLRNIKSAPASAASSAPAATAPTRGAKTQTVLDQNNVEYRQANQTPARSADCPSSSSSRINFRRMNWRSFRSSRSESPLTINVEFRQVNWTPVRSAEPQCSSTNRVELPPTFFDPFTGETLRTDCPSPKMVEVTEQPPRELDPKKASLAVRLHSRWQGFSQEIDEIKAMEEMLRTYMVQGSEVNSGITMSGWSELYMGF